MLHRVTNSYLGGAFRLRCRASVVGCTHNNHQLQMDLQPKELGHVH